MGQVKTKTELEDELYRLCCKGRAEEIWDWVLENCTIKAIQMQAPVIVQGELLPCPFCGGEPNIGSLGGDKENWAIWCKCNMAISEMGINGETKEEIINSWNKRAGREPKSK